MPYTSTGKYYKIVNGKRQYNAKLDKRVGAISGRGAYRNKRMARNARAPRSKAISSRASEPSLGRTLLTEGGSMLGGLFGMPGVGKAAGGALSTILGMGDYAVKENLFLEGRLPQMVNLPGGGGTVIRFQEYISDIYTTADIANPAGFNIQSFLINAANSDCFPWLNQLAQNYEQYYIEGMVFEFRSTSADALNSTNTALGSVMMATQYDVADPVFRTKAEMLNYEYSNSTKPSDTCMHMIECAPNQTVLNGLYCLDGALPAGTDARLYHLGRFSIATVGFQAANVNIGELHVTYQVRLLKPKLYASIGNGIDFAYLNNSTGYSNAQPFASTGWVLSSQSTLAASMNGGVCILPVSSVIKTYRIEVHWIGSGSVAIINPAATLANCTQLQATLVGGTNSQAFVTLLIQTAGNSLTSSFTFGASTLPTGPLSTLIRIMQVPQAVTL